jgi:hypothetical protein
MVALFVMTAWCLVYSGGWGEWTDCNATCGGGYQQRVCNNPSPAHGNILN